MDEKGTSEGQDPSAFLSGITGASVTVKLNSGVVYKDGYMNIALEKTQEYIDGKLRNSYGDVFVRGNNATLYNDRGARYFALVYAPPSLLAYSSSILSWYKRSASSLLSCPSVPVPCSDMPVADEAIDCDDDWDSDDEELRDDGC
ncbi:hypothetical protein UREG_05838 [Uncinocarpus reesii 1704]|uniref:U6 snRNA-associated Sm-like protein LSm6 n=1 Tax=Uncinocarpus reesii (strain UAMH 1704) TaxID=336963 RepID=C4JTP9_UNCRE|nr:uncharacterized protein UREG_05838 [Uncinocarpus reesii 1704]EEP80996.1 hypothetical protein UREG_05838 [Uncinocarpus reesii 1704]